ncbi:MULTISPECIES: OadG family protein [Pseudomonas]|uniref:OadG family protein n=1 Tax=Pseudomonas TaxID=286 RepID=UPI00123AF928|nr:MULTISPECIES: OadG family transporter subunit [Pseudomonas]QIB51593.1 hypothetical protein G3M63_11380 [Pseudomonas sp. OIL-1]
MNSTEMLMEGVDLMIMGMGAVFAFLVSLVVIVTLMSKLLGKYFPDAIPAPKAPSRPKPAPDAVDPELIAVISTAIRQHRSRAS